MRNFSQLKLLDSVVRGHKTIEENTHTLEYIPEFFYCEWIPDHTPELAKVKKKIQKFKPYCCFNHLVGLPTIKYDDERESDPIPFYNYEKRLLDAHLTNNKMATNKCRGAGASELITVRYNAYWYSKFSKPGQRALISAGMSQKHAQVFLGRIKEILDKIPFIYHEPPNSDEPDEIHIKRGGKINTVPATPNAFRSYQNVTHVDLEESSFWDLIDDKPVLKAVKPLIAKSNTRLASLTTPNGQRGFVWDDIFSPTATTKSWKKVRINWREVVGIPEPDPENLEGKDLSFSGLDYLRKQYVRRYDTDKEYRKWYNGFFEVPIKVLINVPVPIININEVLTTYFDNRAEYDQEFDNQFLLSEYRAFGDFEFREDYDQVTW